MSTHMLNYLARQEYLVPHYFRSGRRGRTRYYSYRDLVIARIVQRLLDAGLELKRLKEGLKKLSNNRHWSDGDAPRNARLLATDGRDLFFVQGRSTLLDLTNNGQLAFAFIVDISAARREVEVRMNEARREVEVGLNDEQLQRFDLNNRRIKFA